MTEPYTGARRAEGKIRLGIARLAAGYPFHARVLEQFAVAARPEVGTMAVTIAGDTIPLYHNPDFVLATPADELAGVLLHEAHHVVLGHVLTDPADYPDAWARTVAEEVTANEYITLPLPAGGVTLDLFPDLSPFESTRGRYDRLEQVPERDRSILLGMDVFSAGSDGRPTGGESSDGDAIEPPGPARGRIQSSGMPSPAATTRAGADPGASKPGRPGGPGRTIDDHGVWDSARRDPGRSRETVRVVVQQALLACGPIELPDPLAAAVRALGVGHQPGEGRYELLGDRRGRLGWRRLLRRHVGRALERRPSFNRPPRRFPELVGILPGQRRQVARPRILAVVDTSGSITPDLLEQIDAELAGMARQAAVTVAECDARVHRISRYRGRLGSVLGRGGTDLRPPLERAFLREHRADLVIYFTDGYGPAPEGPPAVPVIWCLVPGGRVPAAWGRVVRMDEGS